MPGALIQHHGVSTTMGGPRAGIYFRVCAGGSHGLPVLIFQFRQEYIGKSSKIREWSFEEVAKLREMAAIIFGPARKCWNGAGCSSFSIGLTEFAHPNLLATVALYRKGCPDHPNRSVFCECGWFAKGNKKMRIPVGFF